MGSGQKECLSVSHRAFAPRGCNAQHTQQRSYELMAQAAGKAEQGAELGAVGKFIGAPLASVRRLRSDEINSWHLWTC